MPKTILVTGGSRGIGRAVALRAGALGWSVAVGYREERTAAEAVVTAVEEIGGGGVVALEGDVAAEADVVATFGGAQAALGPLDGVVVNAGIVGPPSPLADMPVERVRRTIDVNVLGTLLCAREAARRLAVSRGGRGGSIVLVSSAAARLGSPNEYVDYAASKGAVDTLCIGLSRELAADGVRVNAVRPGDRHGDPRERRAARPGATAGAADPSGASGHRRGSGRGDRLAPRRRRLVHDR
jgi:NAD(P)-dependent dehydrogenase (short-subunit alcohol dehydrogenase family)